MTAASPTPYDDAASRQRHVRALADELAQLAGRQVGDRLALVGSDVLDELFVELEAARLADLSGMRAVSLASAPGIDRFGGSRRAALLRALNRVMPLVYRGKIFDGTTGANVFVAGLHAPRFALRDDGSGAAMIDYDIESNFRALRMIAAEVKVVSDTVVLCRMVRRTSGRTSRILYFALDAPRRSREGLRPR